MRFLECITIILLTVVSSTVGLTISPNGNATEDGVKLVVSLDATIDGDLEKDEISIHILGEEPLTFLGVIKSSESWYGELDGDGIGFANFLLDDGGLLTGSVTLQDTVCHVSSKVDGTLRGECILQGDFEIELDPPDIPTPEENGTISTNPEELQYHDIMVVYTLNALCAEAGLPFPCEVTEENKVPIESRVQLAIEETNAAYAMSNVTKGTVRLVHTYLDDNYTEVTEEDEFEASSNYQQMLDDLTDRDDGKLTEVHAFREQYGADIVDLWVETGGACGLAWGACTSTFCNAGYAFSVQQLSCTTGYYTFGHENGHISGCQHDRANDPDIRAFAYGWQDPAQEFRTIMAYDCDNQTCGKVQRFSTPDVTLSGGQAIGDEDNDNSRQLDLTWEEVASFMSVGGTGGDNSTDGVGNGTDTTTSSASTVSWVREGVWALLAGFIVLASL